MGKRPKRGWGGLDPGLRNFQDKGEPGTVSPAALTCSSAPALILSSGDGATAHLETGGFIRSQPGVTHPDIQFHFLPSQVIDHGRKPTQEEAYQVSSGAWPSCPVPPVCRRAPACPPESPWGRSRSREKPAQGSEESSACTRPGQELLGARVDGAHCCLWVPLGACGDHAGHKRWLA